MNYESYEKQLAVQLFEQLLKVDIQNNEQLLQKLLTDKKFNIGFFKFLETNKCIWFNKYEKKISKIIPYFDINYTKVNETFFNDIIHYENENNNFNILDKIEINDYNIFDAEKNKLDLIQLKTDKIAKLESLNKITAIKSTITKMDKKINNYNKVTIVRTYQIYPSDTQKQVILNWMDECTNVYNYCIKLSNKLREKKEFFDLNYKKSKLIVFKDLYGNSEKPAPYDILTDEVRSFCSNLKSSITNLKNGNITHFELSNKNTYKSQSILIPSKSINKDGIFINLLKKMKGFDKINTNNITSDCRLIYDKFFNKFYLKCPFYSTIKKIENRKSIVALDPGEKIFMTYYGFENCGMIGFNIKDKILKYQAKISKIQRIISLKKTNYKNKNNKKLKNKKRLVTKLRTYYKNIKNLVKELHNKTALYLVRNYNKILIPKFETQNMVKCFGKKYLKTRLNEIKNETNEFKKTEYKRLNKVKRLSKRVKFVLNNLSHYSFKQHLLNKAKEYGCEVQIVTEEYTSKCCGRCGLLSDKYNNRLKICPHCNLRIDRDINGSRNILIKNWNNNYSIIRS
jgi:putative transposase